MRPFKDEAWLRFLAIFEPKIIDFKDKLIILLHYQILNEGYTIQSQTDRAPPVRNFFVNSIYFFYYRKMNQ
jgi:hypothetical protein